MITYRLALLVSVSPPREPNAIGLKWATGVEAEGETGRAGLLFFRMSKQAEPEEEMKMLNTTNNIYFNALTHFEENIIDWTLELRWMSERVVLRDEVPDQVLYKEKVNNM